jgi:hypothetical protein
MSAVISPVVQQRSLRLVAGDSRFSVVTFYQGTEVRPFSVGTAADWTVAAEGVLPIHLYLAFDGFSLLVATSCEQAGATVFGQELDRSWTILPEWAELRFGDAVLLLTSEEAPLWTPAKPLDVNATQVLHYPALRRQQTGTAIWSLADLGIRDPSPSPAPTPTVFDQGALRNLADRIAAAQEQAKAAQTLEQAETTPPLDGAALGPAVPEPPALGVVAARDEPALVGDTSFAPPLSRSERLRAQWRNAPLARRALFVLLPLAAAAVVSLADTLLHEPSDESQPSPPGVSSSTAHPKVVDRSVAVSPATAARRTSSPIPAPPPNSSAVARPSTILGDERVRPALDDAAPVSAAKPAASGAPATPESHQPVREQNAIQAARSGKLPEAAALYAGLAVGENAQLFTLASRLVQEGAIRRP